MNIKELIFLREKIIELLMKRKSNSLQLNKVKYKILGQIKSQNYREIESKQQRKNLEIILKKMVFFFPFLIFIP